MLDLFRILSHCALWSVLSIGGNTVALSDIFRYTVTKMRWLTATEFAAYFAISQALPGPNGMALVLIGQKAAGLSGALTALVSKLAPSSLIAYFGGGWYERHQTRPAVITIKAALIPITVGLILSASFVLARTIDTKPSRIILTALAAFIAYRYKANPIWLILGAACLGIASTTLGFSCF